MKLLCWNVNGIRAVERKGELARVLEKHDPDVFFVQETKASKDKLSSALTDSPVYHQFYHAAEKPGYSGTAIWVKKTLSSTPHWCTGMPGFDDTEGRIARVDLDNITLFGVYFPNGGKSADAWQGKMQFYRDFLAHINQLRTQGKQVIWCGDVNCAHAEIDIARPKANEKSIGFLPEERAWISDVITHQWVDVYRRTYPETVMYSWWHMISKARQRNVGWRIDYAFVDQSLYDHVTHVHYDNAQMGSDHCPLVLHIDLPE